MKSHAPEHPRLTPEPIHDQVDSMRQENPKWGKRRIADELKNANAWVAMVSPNTVRWVLVEAGMWEPMVAEKSSPPRCARQRPGHTANVDLCFVPLTHQPLEELPVVSGSSGKLVIQSRATADKSHTTQGEFLKMTNSARPRRF